MCPKLGAHRLRRTSHPRSPQRQRHRPPLLRSSPIPNRRPPPQLLRRAQRRRPPPLPPPHLKTRRRPLGKFAAPKESPPAARAESPAFARFRPQPTVCRRSPSPVGAAEVSPARKGRETKMPSFHSFRAAFSREPFAGTITIFPPPRFSSGPASAVPKRKCLRPFPPAIHRSLRNLAPWLPQPLRDIPSLRGTPNLAWR